MTERFHIGMKVLHGTFHQVGTIVAIHEHTVELHIPGRHLTGLLIKPVAEQNIVTPRASFNYKPGDISGR